MLRGPKTQRTALGKLMCPCDDVHPGWYIRFGLGTWRTRSSSCFRLCVIDRHLQEKSIGINAFPGWVWFEGVGKKADFRPLFYQHLGEHNQKANPFYKIGQCIRQHRGKKTQKGFKNS